MGHDIGSVIEKILHKPGIMPYNNDELRDLLKPVNSCIYEAYHVGITSAQLDKILVLWDNAAAIVTVRPDEQKIYSMVYLEKHNGVYCNAKAMNTIDTAFFKERHIEGSPLESAYLLFSMTLSERVDIRH